LGSHICQGPVAPAMTSCAVQNQPVDVALGINLEGQKGLLGLWVGEGEGARFWLNVMTELKTDS